MSDQPTHIVFRLFVGVTQLDFAAPHPMFSRVPGARVIVAFLGGRDRPRGTRRSHPISLV